MVVETLNRLQSNRAGSHGTLLRTGRTATRLSLAVPVSLTWLACPRCHTTKKTHRQQSFETFREAGLGEGCFRHAKRPRSALMARTANCAMVSADCRPIGGASFSMIVDVDAVVNRLAIEDDSGWNNDAAR